MQALDHLRCAQQQSFGICPVYAENRLKVVIREVHSFANLSQDTSEQQKLVDGQSNIDDIIFPRSKSHFEIPPT